MPSSSSFSGIGLSLQSVTPKNNNGVLRVRFTNDPKQSNPGDANDALNPLNWVVQGPGFVGISSIAPAGGDTQAVDITLSSKLTVGTWSVTVSNVQTSAGVNLTPPTTLIFNVQAIINTTSINPGSSNDDCESLLRKHLNPALKGPGWNATIAGIAAGDCPVFDNTKLAFDQLYINTASGIYLDRITANDGIVRPKNVGINDETYRHLATKVKNHKVVQQALLEVLSVYYGEDAVRAHATTEGFEPYALSDGDDLNVTIDGLFKVKVVFKTAEFQLIGAATAVEVAGAITRQFLIAGVSAFARPFIDPLDGENKVKIYTGSLGLKGSVQILGSSGGKAQSVLQFETPINGTNGTGIVYTGPVVPSTDPDPIVLGTPCTLTWSLVKPMRSPKEQFGSGAQFQDGRVLTSPAYNFQDPNNSAYNNKWELYSADGQNRIDIPNHPFTTFAIGQCDMVTLGDGRILAAGDNGTKMATLDPGSLTWTAQPDAPFSLQFAVGATMDDGNAIYVGCGSFSGDRTLIYDQITDTWSEVAPPNNPRIRSAGCLLDNGHMFVCGGDNQNTAETYNPITDTWTNCSNTFGEDKIWHAVAKLANGDVLITGGSNFFLGSNKVYLYRSQFNFIQSRNNMPKALNFHMMKALQNNYVCLVGGVDSNAFPSMSNSVYFYNPNTDTWADSGTPLQVPRCAGCLFELPQPCRIIVCGGEVDGFREAPSFAVQSTPVVEVANLGAPSTYYSPPGSFSWNITDNLPQARTNLTGVTLQDGSFIVFGGQDVPDEVGPTAWYNDSDLINSTGTATTPTSNPLPWFASHVQATVLKDGRVFACGGWTSQTTGSDQAGIYDPVLDQWSGVASMPVALRDHRVALLDAFFAPTDGQVILIGGRQDDGSGWGYYTIYDPIGNTWSTPVALPTAARWGGAISTGITLSGFINYYCGWTDSGPATDILSYQIISDAMYDSTSTFIPQAFRPEYARTADGKMMLCGGWDDLTDFGNTPQPIAETVLFLDFGGEFQSPQVYESYNTFSGLGKAEHKILQASFSENYFLTAINGVGPFGSGLFVADIWDTLVFPQPPDPIATLDGPSFGSGGPERGFAAFKTSDGKMLVVGGYDQSDSFIAQSAIWKSTN